MRKNSIGAMAVILALSVAGFSAPEEKNTEYYWFHYEEGIVLPLHISIPPQQSPPFYCDGEGTFICTQAFLPQDTEIYFDLYNFSFNRRPRLFALEEVTYLSSHP